jgi:hypothetical protein
MFSTTHDVVEPLLTGQAAMREACRLIRDGDPLAAWEIAVDLQAREPQSPVALSVLSKAYEGRVLYRSSLVVCKVALGLAEKDGGDPQEYQRIKAQLSSLTINTMASSSLPPAPEVHLPPLYSPPSVGDHHGVALGADDGGMTPSASGSLSVYKDCLRQKPTDQQETMFAAMELKEIRRDLLVPASARRFTVITNNTQLFPDQDKFIYFPRIILVRSFWSSEEPKDESPAWKFRVISDRHYLAKFNRVPIGSDHSSPRYRLLLDEYSVEIWRCPAVSVNADSKPILFTRCDDDRRLFHVVYERRRIPSFQETLDANYDRFFKWVQAHKSTLKEEEGLWFVFDEKDEPVYRSTTKSDAFQHQLGAAYAGHAVNDIQPVGIGGAFIAQSFPNNGVVPMEGLHFLEGASPEGSECT